MRSVGYNLHTVRRERSFKQGAAWCDLCISKSTLALCRDAGEDDHTGERR